MSGLVASGFEAWREARAEYDLLLYAAYERAAEACRDRLVNERGRRRGIDPVSLFMGPERRALAYASEELREHWQTFPRVTFADFERQWLRDQRHAAHSPEYG